MTKSSYARPPGKTRGLAPVGLGRVGVGTLTSAPVRRIWFGLGILVILLLAGSCARGEDDTAVVVEMADNRFESEVYNVPVGARVQFVNVGRNPHNAVAVDKTWTTESSFGELRMDRGDSTTLTFDRPGTYRFLCTYHAAADGTGMAATLQVGGGAVAAAAAQSTAPPNWTGVTRRVPEDHPSIQGAVDAAAPGDLVLIGEGVYREAVTVTTPGLVIRGTDRNRVVIDGEFTRPNGINVVEADGVAVENLTVRNHTLNGLYWTGVTGYRASYVTAYDNADYGIYAFDSRDGLFEHSYASGSPDSGFYVGQCDPCDAVLTDLISEWNALGYSGTNASGNVFLLNSVWRHNLAGIVPNTLDSELLAPFHDVTIMGNLVHDNGNADAPALALEWAVYGHGIVLTGGDHSRVERNRVINHPGNGIVVTPSLDEKFWTAEDNEVRDNLVEGSGRADLALAGPAGTGNCFEANQFRSSLPVWIERVQSCSGWRLPARFELGVLTEGVGRLVEGNRGLAPEREVGSAPTPGPQPSLPGGAGAEVHPAVNVFASFPLDLASISVPDSPGIAVTQQKGITMFGIAMAGVLPVLFGLYGYFLPFVLYAAWVAIALWDLTRRVDLSRGATLGWIAVILLVPFLGVILYYIRGRSSIPGWQRLAFVGGGMLAYLIILAVGALVGGVV